MIRKTSKRAKPGTVGADAEQAPTAVAVDAMPGDAMPVNARPVDGAAPMGTEPIGSAATGAAPVDALPPEAAPDFAAPGAGRPTADVAPAWGGSGSSAAGPAGANGGSPVRAGAVGGLASAVPAQREAAGPAGRGGTAAGPRAGSAGSAFGDAGSARSGSPGRSGSGRSGSARSESLSSGLAATSESVASNGKRPAGSPAEQQQPAGSRWALRNWRVRSRLLVLTSIPTIAALAFGGLSISAAVQTAASYQRVTQLAGLSANITRLVQALQDERAAAVSYAVQTPGGATGTSGSAGAAVAAAASALHHDQVVMAALAGRVSAGLGAVGSSFPAVTRQDAAAAQQALGGLPAALAAQPSAIALISQYDAAISALLAVSSQADGGSSDAAMSGTVSVTGLVSQLKEEASRQQAVLLSGLAPSLTGRGKWSSAQQALFTNAQTDLAGNLAQFLAAATPSQRQMYAGAGAGQANRRSLALQQPALALATSPKPSQVSPAIFDASRAAAAQVSSLGAVESQLVNSVVTRSQALRSRAVTLAVVEALAVLLVLALALILTSLIGTTMVRPLRRLRAGALEVAAMRLPEAVRLMNETDGSALPADIDLIDVQSVDEIGQVARAFDQVHREALRLAANEAALRGNVNAMFVNLSRRSQSLVERQIRLIDDLEQGEQDSERLSSLFQMDHLATRMRRNSENLLVLAGHDVSRRWNQPVSLVDVLRAAVSEIEQYERVTLNVQPGISVRGQAVSDIVHLTAELVENATSFSPASLPVTIVGHQLGSGGVLLEVTDEGVGMETEEMAHANWRLDNPPVVDVAVSRRMGLFVVARLAARHGIRVRLRAATSAGLTALVWLPDEVISGDGAAGRAGDGAFDAALLAAGTGAGGAEDGMPLAAAGLPELTEWDVPGQANAAREVHAALTPRFAPLRADAGAAGLSQRRVPGAGPRPGSSVWETDAGAASGGATAAPDTGPLPVFRTSPQPALRTDAETAGEDALDEDQANAGGRPVDGTPHDDERAEAAGNKSAEAESNAAESAEAETAEAETADARSAGSNGSQLVPGTGLGQAAAANWSFGADLSDTRPGALDTGPLPVREPSELAGAGSDVPGSNVPGAEPSGTESSGTESAGTESSGIQSSSTESAGDGSSGNGSPVGGHSSAGSWGPPVLGAAAGSTGRTGTGYDWSSGPFGDVVVPPPASLEPAHRLPIFEAVESDWFRDRTGGNRPNQRQAPAGDSESNGSGAESIGSGSGSVDATLGNGNGGVQLSDGSGAADGDAALSNGGGSANGSTAISDGGSANGNAAADSGGNMEFGSSASRVDAGPDDWGSPADAGWRAADTVTAPSSGGVTIAGLPKRVPRANLVPGAAAVDSTAPAPAPARSAAATRERLASFQRGIRQARSAPAPGANPDGAAPAGEEPGAAAGDDSR